MKTQTKRKPRGQKPGSQKVRIEFHTANAREVCVAGDFNEWHPKATPMLNMGKGHWVKELVLPPGRYEYQLVTDGEWKCDSAAPERVSTPFGSFNSILEVSSGSEKEQST